MEHSQGSGGEPVTLAFTVSVSVTVSFTVSLAKPEVVTCC
jgi:hypothetical protein